MNLSALFVIFLGLVLASAGFVVYFLLFGRHYQHENVVRKSSIHQIQQVLLLKSLSVCSIYSMNYNECMMAGARAISYCGLEIDSGKEGYPSPANSNLILKSVFAVIRAGDVKDTELPSYARLKDSTGQESSHSPSSTILQTRVDSRSDIYLDPRAARFAGPSSVTATILSDQPSPKWSAKPDHLLSPGQLTSIGYMQMRTVGKIMMDAYRNGTANGSIGNDEKKDDINIYIPNTSSSVQSVNAVLDGLLESSRRSATTRVSLLARDYRPLLALETVGMSGVVLNVNVQEKVDRVLFAPSCPNADILARQQVQELLKDEPKQADLVLKQYFGSNRTLGELRSIIDHSLSQYCHGNALPCSVKPAEHPCLKPAMLVESMTNYDLTLCGIIMGTAGGLSSTKLKIYPILIQIANDLLRPALYNPTTSLLLDDYAMIQSILSGLHIAKHHVCGLPSVGSRLIFELWESVATKDNNESFVRVVLNGLPISNLIPACGAQRRSLRKSDGGSATKEFCPMNLFLKQIQSIVNDSIATTGLEISSTFDTSGYQVACSR